MPYAPISCSHVTFERAEAQKCLRSGHHGELGWSEVHLHCRGLIGLNLGLRDGQANKRASDDST